jgi:hypothetical protein
MVKHSAKKKLNMKKPSHFGSDSDCSMECQELENQLRFMKMTLDALIQSDFEQLNSLKEHPADKATWTQISRTINEDPKILHMLELEPRNDRLAITQFLWRFMHGGYDNYKGEDKYSPEEERAKSEGKEVRELRNGGAALGRAIDGDFERRTYISGAGGNLGNTGGGAAAANNKHNKNPTLDKNTGAISNKTYRDENINNVEYGYADNKWHRLDSARNVEMKDGVPAESHSFEDFTKMIKAVKGESFVLRPINQSQGQGKNPRGDNGNNSNKGQQPAAGGGRRDNNRRPARR